MTLSQFCNLPSIAIWLASILLFVGTTAADEPEGIPRYFAELTTPAGACIDWEADDSRRIVAHRAGNDPDVIQFGTPGNGWLASDFVVRDEDGNTVLDLRDTTWVQAPIVHVTNSGAEHVPAVYWLVDGEADAKVPAGLTARTGPDGDVLAVVSFRVSQIPESEGFNGGKFRVTANGHFRMCASIGMFNK